MLKLARNLAYIGFLFMPALYLRLYRNFSLSDAFIVASFLLFITANPSKVLFAVSKNPLNVPFFIFFIGFSLSTVFADQMIEAFFGLAQLLFGIYVVTTLIFLCNTKVVLAMIATSVALHSVLAILFLAGILDIGIIALTGAGFRLTIGDVEPNVAARVFFVGATIMFFSHSKVKWFLLKWLTVLAILATFSRSGFLALISLFAGVLRKKLHVFLAAGMIVMLLIAFTPIGDISPIKTYTGRIVDALHLADYNVRARLFMITRGVEIVAETYLIGTGMNNRPADVGGVHNMMVGAAVETGIFGLFGLLAMYLIIFKIARSLERKFGMLTVMVVGTFLFDMFMSFSQNRIFWFPFSLVLAMYLQRLHFSHKYTSAKASTEPKCAESNYPLSNK